jgi:hypothetical protein
MPFHLRIFIGLSLLALYVCTFIPCSCDISLQSCLFCLPAPPPDHLPAAWTQTEVTERLEHNAPGPLPPSLPMRQPYLGCTTCTTLDLGVSHVTMSKLCSFATCSCTTWLTTMSCSYMNTVCIEYWKLSREKTFTDFAV